MKYKQTVNPNLDPIIYNGGVALNDWLGWCLGYVTAAFSVPNKYKVWRAIWAWNGSVAKHTDRNFPKDVYFLVWFNHYGKYDNSGDNSWGHVAIAYINSLTGAMTIYSSPISRKPTADTWTSIAQIEQKYSSTYIGWSEDNNGFRIIEAVPDAPATPKQRVTAAKCYAREQPNTNATVFQEIDANEPIEMKGFVTNGEAVEGNTTWFVTARSGKYMSAQVFKDTGTHDLADLTPKPPVVPPPTPTPVEPKPVDDASYHIVVNKKHPLGIDYEPTDLVSVGNGQMMRKDAASMLKAMQNDSGVNVLISPASGYRSYTKQQEVYNSYDAATRDTYSARPGYSEHQTGLAMDFSPIDTVFENSPAFAWLQENAYRYGFVLRFPNGKEKVTGYQYEPWHWRYVGADASRIKASGKTTLEEFYGVEGGDYLVPVEPTPIDPTPVDPTDPTQNPLWKVFESIVNFLLSIVNKLNPKK